ncbi:DUF5615 family PIN-like protein [Telluribacter sp.]|jgi:predicted nuclease of predicted toxin-antitoxin system|uniref:DUF5615 family PIN-like protein n=1 Tax=Telluribacter sp. TaxID=1978767 RepID=UPI002E0EACCA|nr:DUF5615 family PIN-like protein [Telluribacter sp.]
MKLLVDQNISYRLLGKIEGFPATIRHVKDEGLIDANDHTIFMYARSQGFDAVVTLDDDFVRLLNAYSAPPKVVWIRTGNCSTAFLADLILDKAPVIKEFIESADFILYELF